MISRLPKRLQRRVRRGLKIVRWNSEAWFYWLEEALVAGATSPQPSNQSVVPSLIVYTKLVLSTQTPSCKVDFSLHLAYGFSYFIILIYSYLKPPQPSNQCTLNWFSVPKILHVKVDFSLLFLAFGLSYFILLIYSYLKPSKAPNQFPLLWCTQNWFLVPKLLHV